VRNVTLYRHHAVLSDRSITGHLKYNTCTLYCKSKNVHKNIQPGHEKYTFLYKRVYLCHLQVYYIKEKMKNRNKIVKLKYYFQ